MVSHSCVCALLKEPNDHSLIILGIKTSQCLGSWELCCQQSFSLSQITERRFWKKHGGRQLRGRIPEHSTSMLNKKKAGKKHLLSRMQRMGCDSGVLNGKAAASWFYLSQPLPEPAQPCWDKLLWMQQCQGEGGTTWDIPDR